MQSHFFKHSIFRTTLALFSPLIVARYYFSELQKDKNMHIQQLSQEELLNMQLKKKITQKHCFEKYGIKLSDDLVGTSMNWFFIDRERRYMEANPSILKEIDLAIEQQTKNHNTSSKIR